MDHVQYKATSDTLSTACRRTRDKYLSKGHSLYDIGNGLCSEFAEDMLAEAFGEEWMHHESKYGWHTVWTDQLYLPVDGEAIYAVEWDWSAIEKSFDLRFSNEEKEVLNNIVAEDPSHCWVYHDGKHYDCEHPDGVDSFFDLNFFKRWRGIGVDDTPTPSAQAAPSP